MQRYSLYIDHQLVSGMIRQLENIVRICRGELDDEYQTYELRTSIYEEFVFQVAATFNTKYAFKQEEDGVKDEQLKKFYQLTTKLEGINSTAKIEDIHLHSGRVKKGRPSKHQEAEDKLAQWINDKVKNEGKLKFLKKQLDDIYLPLITEEKKKVHPVNFYLRILKRYELNDVSIVARGGKQKTVKDLIESKNLSNSFWRKEEEDQSTIKYEFVSGQLQSTSEIQSQLQSNFQNNKNDRMITKASRFDDNQGINSQKRKLRSSKGNQSKKDLKLRKQRQKRKTFNNILDDNSDQEGDYNHWDNNLSISNDLMEEAVPNAEIYENSKSFE